MKKAKSYFFVKNVNSFGPKKYPKKDLKRGRWPPKTKAGEKKLILPESSRQEIGFPPLPLFPPAGVLSLPAKSALVYSSDLKKRLRFSADLPQEKLSAENLKALLFPQNQLRKEPGCF